MKINALLMSPSEKHIGVLIATGQYILFTMEKKLLRKPRCDVSMFIVICKDYV